MKKVYNSPELDIQDIYVEDILTASNSNTMGDTGLAGVNENIFPTF